MKIYFLSSLAKECKHSLASFLRKAWFSFIKENKKTYIKVYTPKRMNVLSLTYLGNIEYYTKLCFSDCVIDIHENYVKQSYRTRCDIVCANGVMPLVVNSVKTPNFNKATVKDIRLDYSKRWQHQHWQSLVSGYRNSPFFDHYADLFEPFYTKRFDFLLDFNTGLLELCLKLLGSDVRPQFSGSYIDSHKEPEMTDYRNSISPKPRLSRPDPAFDPAPYWQVFSERHGFIPNLSVIDLLFCEGPSSLGILRSSISPTDI